MSFKKKQNESAHTSDEEDPCKTPQDFARGDGNNCPSQEALACRTRVNHQEHRSF